LANGQLFAFGANGHLVRLDPATGAEVWTVDVAKLADRSAPAWGFSSSPLVVGSSVVVHAGGSDEKGVLGFDVVDGQVKWSVSSGDHTYSSPQLCDVDGEEVIVMLTNKGAQVLDPTTGKIRIDYLWNTGGYRALQPTFVSKDSFLIPTDGGNGIRRVGTKSNDGTMEAREIWTSTAMKTDFNDMVFYKDHLYGFDGAIFACINAETGKRVWKGGRYGKGQVLMMENSALLLVASEKGEAVLIKADPASHQELAKFKAIEGKTWNHPVVVDDRLYIRNGEQAACYRLPLGPLE
jgi:outer membrane protein assembly factor BamB